MTLEKRIYLLLGVIIVCSLLLIVLVVQPLFTEIKNNSLELVSQKQELAELEAEIEGLMVFKTRYREIKEDLLKIDSLFVDPAPVNFINYIEELAQESNVSLEISSVSDKQDFIFFSMNSIGYFEDLLRFLERIEVSHYLIDIQSLKIRKPLEAELKSGELSLNDIKMDLSIKTYKR